MTDIKEINEYEGACIYCGQIQITHATSQEAANRIATLNCTCDMAVTEQKKEKLFENIEHIVGNGCEDYGFKAVSEEMMDLIKHVALEVFEDNMQAAQIAIDNTVIKISLNTKGNVKVTRTEKKSIASEC